MDSLITITIATNNDAFGNSPDERASEVARILRHLAARLEANPFYLDPASGVTPTLNDINGNRVGHLSLECDCDA